MTTKYEKKINCNNDTEIYNLFQNHVHCIYYIVFSLFYLLLLLLW